MHCPMILQKVLGLEVLEVFLLQRLQNSGFCVSSLKKHTSTFGKKNTSTFGKKN